MKSIFEQGGTYHEENGYLIPGLRLSTEEEQPTGEKEVSGLAEAISQSYIHSSSHKWSTQFYLAYIDKQAQGKSSVAFLFREVMFYV